MANKTTITAEPGKLDLTIVREFDAPRDLVFRAYTEEQLYKQWLGPRGYRTDFKTFQPHSSGAWSYISTDPQGNQYGFHGVYHDVTAPERIIGTFEFEGLPEPGHVMMETAHFQELPGGRTRVTSQSIFQSVADRDGMIQSGMEYGVNDGYERLDELLAKLK